MYEDDIVNDILNKIERRENIHLSDAEEQKEATTIQTQIRSMIRAHQLARHRDNIGFIIIS
jgi:hypothetical protein